MLAHNYETSKSRKAVKLCMQPSIFTGESDAAKWAKPMCSFEVASHVVNNERTSYFKYGTCMSKHGHDSYFSQDLLLAYKMAIRQVSSNRPNG